MPSDTNVNTTGLGPDTLLQAHAGTCRHMQALIPKGRGTYTLSLRAETEPHTINSECEVVSGASSARGNGEGSIARGRG